MGKSVDKFESKVEGLTKEQVEGLAEEGRHIAASRGKVEKGSLQAFAIAAVIRLENESRAKKKHRKYPTVEKESTEQAA